MISILMTVLASNFAVASDKEPKTIPFVYEVIAKSEGSGRKKAELPDTEVKEQFWYREAASGKLHKFQTTTQIATIDSAKISGLVQSARDAICSGIKKGAFKIWLKLDASNKILGIGASTEGGIEVYVECR